MSAARKGLGIVRGTVLLLTGAVALYSLAQHKLPEEYHLGNIVGNAITRSADAAEPELSDVIEPISPVNNIVIRWERVMNKNFLCN